MSKKKPEGYEPWTVGVLKDILNDYEDDSTITIVQYPSFKTWLVYGLWHIPFLTKWAVKHELDIFPARNIEFVFGDKDSVSLG